jgi:hypothetical protein
MDDEELYVPDDVLEEASAARYQMLPLKSERIGNIWEEWKPVSERQWAKVKWTKEKPSSTGNYWYRLTFYYN